MLPWALSAGCQLGYFLVDPEKEKGVKAEYGRLAGHKVAVVVWADRSTLDIYPRTCYRVGKAVAYYMKKHLPDARFVRAEKVAHLQDRSGIDWQAMSPEQLCEHLACDVVLRVDLLEYTTRAIGTRQLRKGRVRATVALYERGQTAGEEAAYQTEVLSTYPPASLHGAWDKDDGQILHETVELFAEAVARKFYDHGIPMRGPSGG
jgi:hypothetical protein